MLTFVLFAATFCLGFVAGAYLRGAAFENQEWRVMKWSKESLGYRPLPFGSMIKKNDKVIMALHMDTKYFPPDGIKYSRE